MDAAQAIAMVSDLVQSQGLDYPTADLQADRFEMGWSVYAPGDLHDSERSNIVNTPVLRSVFLVGDSGRIEQVPTSIPFPEARERFSAQEAVAPNSAETSHETQFMAELQQRFHELDAQGPPTISEFTIIDTPRDNPGTQRTLLDDEASIATEASRLLDPIVQQLAMLGPHGWERYSAVFAFTVSGEVAQLRFWSSDRNGLVPVPESIADLVRQQREVAAAMPAGPWWRLLLTVTNRGEMTADYDYGDQPFPDDQLLAPEHYRNDLDAYPRAHVPVWLAGYTAGPIQRRDPRQAAADIAADTDAGRTPTVAHDIPALPELWSRWAVLSAAYTGAKSQWGPRISPAHGWYESDRRSGSTLYILPGQRAILSGGTWNSALLEAAYNGGQPLPDLYTAAPAWVNDTVLNTRNRNGLLTFCYWSTGGHWYRGATDTVAELNEAIPPIWTADNTVQIMTTQTGPDTKDQCHRLLTAAGNHTATRDDVAAIFIDHPDADIEAAMNQLSLAGALAP